MYAMYEKVMSMWFEPKTIYTPNKIESYLMSGIYVESRYSEH